MRAARNEHHGVMDAAKVDALCALSAPHDMCLAGIVARADLLLQPSPRQLVRLRVRSHRQPDRKLPIHYLIAIWCFASHGLGTYKEHL